MNNWLKSKQDLQTIRKGCGISMEILHSLLEMIEPGIDAYTIDQRAVELCKKNRVRSAFKGYAPRGLPPFPSTVSVCINNEVVHGISTKDKVIQKGDLVTLDFGIVYEKYFTDHCITVGVGEISQEDQRLLETGKLAVTSSISKAINWGTTGDIGNVMHTISKLAGYDTVKNYIGHGIGKTLHETPEIPAYGYPGQGERLEEGMILCLEAQVVSGTDRVKIAQDQWTVLTADDKKCVWFEYMVLVTNEKPEVLTDTRDWPLIV